MLKVAACTRENPDSCGGGGDGVAGLDARQELHWTAVAGAPGLWEITGVPGTKAPVRECIGDLVVARPVRASRAQLRTKRVISDGASATTVEYRCRDGGFGRSTIGPVTPRTLRIDTQGISDGLPFGYVVQARSVGECPAQATAAAH